MKGCCVTTKTLVEFDHNVYHYYLPIINAVAEGEVHGFRRALIIVFEVRVQEMVLIQCNRIIPNAAQQCHANMKYFKKDKKIKLS